MNHESIVYGCIKDEAEVDVAERRRVNQLALEGLAPADTWPVLSREMFSTSGNAGDISFHTDVTHFGASYQGIEYEWKLWLEQFEHLLRKMYWVSATVHLETDISGTHTFVWEADGGEHCPGHDNIALRCEWVHE